MRIVTSGQMKKIEENALHYALSYERMMENAGSVVSRDTIMIHLWDSENFIDDNTLTVNITRIRKKLKDIGLDDFVKTKKGIGYMV